MKTSILKKIAAVGMSGFLVMYPLIGVSSPLWAAPPEGKGNERAQEAANQGNGQGDPGNQGNRGNSDNARGERSELRGLDRAELVRQSAEQAHSRQAGGKNFHAQRPGDFGQRELPIQASENAANSVSRRADAGRGREAASLRDQNRRIVEDFERTIGELRKKERSRWWFNPHDERGQGNRAKIDMLDPYGHSKDDRMELDGNRGRPIREIEEEILTLLYTKYLFMDGWVLYYWSQIMGVAAQTGNIQYPAGLYDWSIFSAIYSPEEIAFLQTLTLDQMMLGYQNGHLTMPTSEMTLASASQLDLSQIINFSGVLEPSGSSSYGDPYSVAGGGWFYQGLPVEYNVSLTNIYDTPLTLTVEAAVYNFFGVNQYPNVGKTIIDGATFSYPTLLDYQLRPAAGSDAVQSWENITLQPGETLILSDTYTDYQANWWLYRSNPQQQLVVTVTDLVTSLSYTDPYAGWFF